MDKNQKTFVVSFEKSHTAVWFVARWFWEVKKKTVTIPKSEIAPSHKQWKEYVDDGDLYVDGKRIEIKHSSYMFTNTNDFPFKHFIFCAKHSFDNAKEKPYMYFVVNRDKTKAAIIYGADCSHWYVIRKQDKRYENCEQDFYCCPKSKIRFITLQ